jgi:hypothetical protein
MGMAYSSVPWSFKVERNVQRMFPESETRRSRPFSLGLDGRFDPENIPKFLFIYLTHEIFQSFSYSR